MPIPLMFSPMSPPPSTRLRDTWSSSRLLLILRAAPLHARFARAFSLAVGDGSGCDGDAIHGSVVEDGGGEEDADEEDASMRMSMVVSAETWDTVKRVLLVPDLRGVLETARPEGVSERDANSLARIVTRMRHWTSDTSMDNEFHRMLHFVLAFSEAVAYHWNHVQKSPNFHRTSLSSSSLSRSLESGSISSEIPPRSPFHRKSSSSSLSRETSQQDVHFRDKSPLGRRGTPPHRSPSQERRQQSMRPSKAPGGNEDRESVDGSDSRSSCISLSSVHSPSVPKKEGSRVHSGRESSRHHPVSKTGENPASQQRRKAGIQSDEMKEFEEYMHFRGILLANDIDSRFSLPSTSSNDSIDVILEKLDLLEERRLKCENTLSSLPSVPEPPSLNYSTSIKLQQISECGPIPSFDFSENMSSAMYEAQENALQEFTKVEKSFPSNSHSLFSDLERSKRDVERIDLVYREHIRVQDEVKEMVTEVARAQDMLRSQRVETRS